MSIRLPRFTFYFCVFPWQHGLKGHVATFGGTVFRGRVVQGADAFGLIPYRELVSLRLLKGIGFSI